MGHKRRRLSDFLTALELGWWRNVIPHEEHEDMPVDVALRPAPIVGGGAARSCV